MSKNGLNRRVQGQNHCQPKKQKNEGSSHVYQKKHLNDPQDLCEKTVVSGMNLNSSSSIRLRYFKHAVHVGNLQIWPN